MGAEPAQPRGIRQVHRVVRHVREQVQPRGRLEVLLRRRFRVPGDEAADGRVIVARPQVVVAALAVPLLAGEQPVVGAGARLCAASLETERGVLIRQ